MSYRSKSFLQFQLARADVLIGGDRPWDVHIQNDALYDRVLQ